MKKLLVLVLCVLVLSSCAPNTEYEKTIFSMDTQITLTAYGDCAQQALEQVEKEINRIDKKYSVSAMAENSEIVDDETKHILSVAKKISQKTDGAFDIRVAPLMSLWGFHSEEFKEKNYHVPSTDEINAVLAEIPNNKSMDLGGIAKGYAADRAVEILKENGVTSAVISLGGNVAVIGNNPKGKNWSVGIQSPFDNSIYATVYLSDTSVVTSGDYVRFFEKNGKKYHHIIDTSTGYPAESDLTSVTIISENSAEADALSTGLYILGKDKAIDLWRKDMSFQMILIDKQGTIYYTEDLELATKHNCVVIKMQ